MKLFYTISFCIINLIAFSQSNAWTKAERTTLYNDCGVKQSVDWFTKEKLGARIANPRS